jgi:tRNA(Ile)-lysidine synthase
MSVSSTEPVSAAEAKDLFADLRAAPVLVLAVSGGPDSTALMVLAARWAKALKRAPALVAVTIDHGLRAESKKEAREVAKLARRLGIAHRTLRWTGVKPKTGLPEAARVARYGLLAAAARKAGAAHVLTAHTLDDQAETVMIRMMRGSGMTGLAAMARVALLPSPSPLAGKGWGGGVRASNARPDLPPSRRASRVDLPRKGGGEKRDDVARDLLLVRPLLSIPKARLIATLAAAKIAFADDPTNRDTVFTRARLRGLMPLLAQEGLDARRLSLLAARLKRADEALTAAADRVWRDLGAGQGTQAFDAALFAALPDEVALRLLGRAIDERGDEGPVELGKLEALCAALKAAQNTGSAFRRSLAGALVSFITGGKGKNGKITVERAPPRRKSGVAALTKHRSSSAGKPEKR